MPIVNSHGLRGQGCGHGCHCGCGLGDYGPGGGRDMPVRVYDPLYTLQRMGLALAP